MSFEQHESIQPEVYSGAGIGVIEVVGLPANVPTCPEAVYREIVRRGLNGLITEADAIAAQDFLGCFEDVMEQQAERLDRGEHFDDIQVPVLFERSSGRGGGRLVYLFTRGVLSDRDIQEIIQSSSPVRVDHELLMSKIPEKSPRYDREPVLIPLSDDVGDLEDVLYGTERLLVIKEAKEKGFIDESTYRCVLDLLLWRKKNTPDNDAVDIVMDEEGNAFLRCRFPSTIEHEVREVFRDVEDDQE